VVEIDVEQFDEEIGGDFGWQPVTGAKVKETTGTSRGGITVRGRKTARAQRRPAPALRAKAERLLAERNFAAILADRDILAILQPPAIWEGTVTLPQIGTSVRRRLVIKEYERHVIDGDHVAVVRGQPDPRLRLVYAEAIEL
jgi:hypothetical protein